MVVLRNRDMLQVITI